MPRYDMAVIVTVEATSFEKAEEFLIGWTDGLADNEKASFTTVGHTNETDNNGQRVIYLHAETEESSGEAIPLIAD